MSVKRNFGSHSRDYQEKKEEIYDKLNDVADLREKLNLGLSLKKKFYRFCSKRYPLHKVGSERLIDFIRNNEAHGSGKDEFYHGTFSKDEIAISEDNSESLRITKEMIEIAIDVNSCLNKVNNLISDIKNELEIQVRIAPVDNYNSINDKVAFLTELKYSNATKKFKDRKALCFAIEQKKKDIQGSTESIDSYNFPKLKLNIDLSELVELIAAQYEDGTFLNQETGGKANLIDIIRAYEAICNVDLKNYQQLKKTLLTHKKITDGKSYLLRLDSCLDEVRKEMINKEARVKR